jgi:hypothetical protein
MCFMTLDDKIRNGLPLSLNDFIKINNEGIRIHQKFLKLTGDDHSVTGTDQYHQEFIDFYTQAIEYARMGQSSLTQAEIIEKYMDDANNHLRIINENHTSEAEGDAAHQAKWYWRWIAAGSFIESMV